MSCSWIPSPSTSGCGGGKRKDQTHLHTLSSIVADIWVFFRHECMSETCKSRHLHALTLSGLFAHVYLVSHETELPDADLSVVVSDPTPESSADPQHQRTAYAAQDIGDAPAPHRFWQSVYAPAAVQSFGPVRVCPTALWTGTSARTSNTSSVGMSRFIN